MSAPPSPVRWRLGAILLCLLACTPEQVSPWPDGSPDAGEAGGGPDGGPDGAASEAGTSAEVASVVTAAARDGDLILWVRTTGVVHADASLLLRADLAGVVGAMAVQEGDAVRVRDSLGHFDPEPFDLAVREAEARLAEAEQRVLDSYLPDSLVTGQAPSPLQRHAREVRAGVLSARVAAERARRDRARVTVRSPMRGIVDRVFVHTGEQVATGQPILQLVDAAQLRVDAQLLEHDLPHIRPGARARIRTVADPAHPRWGVVMAVLPTVDTSAHAGRVLLRVPAPGVLRPGMSVDVELEGERVRARRLVPTRAVLERDGRPLVFLQRNGRAHWTFVVPGRSNGVETELLPDPDTGRHTVPAGARVLVAGHETLTHEAPVREGGAPRLAPSR